MHWPYSDPLDKEFFVASRADSQRGTGNSTSRVQTKKGGKKVLLGIRKLKGDKERAPRTACDVRNTMLGEI